MKWHDIPVKVADKSLLPNSADSLQLNVNFDQMGVYHTFQSNIPDLVRENIGDKPPMVSAQRISGGLYKTTEQVWSAHSELSIELPEHIRTSCI